jgi:RNA polymerase sigma factor (sigma-70 family)
MGSDYQNDVDLAERVAQGDAGAFDEFYARHADLVFAFICQLLNGARADAEELWQDTFIAALRALPGYRGQSRLSSWLCSIARRKVADFHRRQGRAASSASPVPPDRLLELMDTVLLGNPAAFFAYLLVRPPRNGCREATPSRAPWERSLQNQEDETA